MKTYGENEQSSLVQALREEPDNSNALAILAILAKEKWFLWESLEELDCSSLSTLNRLGFNRRHWLAGFIRAHDKTLKCGCPHVCNIQKHYGGQCMLA